MGRRRGRATPLDAVTCCYAEAEVGCLGCLSWGWRRREERARGKVLVVGHGGMLVRVLIAVGWATKGTP